MKPVRVKTASGLLEFLEGFGFTRTKIRQLLKHHAITVNGRIARRHDQQLSVDDEVAFDAKPKPGSAILEEHGIIIVYEDEAVIVIEKPSGLLTIATESEKKETAYYLLNAFFRERDPARPDRIYIVHRLDRETSGLLVFAKDESAKKKLQDNWQAAEKRYFAVAEGVPKKPEGKLESYLNETKAHKVYSVAKSEDAKHAVTHYRVLKTGKAYSLLDLVLETGRKHQIRVQLSDMGCPVAGDKKYGAQTNPIRRVALHAYSLSFVHPASRKMLHFTSPMPKPFENLVGKLS